MGYSRGIQGVFTGYSYVSVMCRLCIGYVSEQTWRWGGLRQFSWKKIEAPARCAHEILINLFTMRPIAYCVLRNILPPLLISPHAKFVRLILSKCGGNNTKCQLVYKFLKTHKERWALKTPKLFQLKNLRNRIFFCTFAADFVRICVGRACEQLKRDI